MNTAAIGLARSWDTVARILSGYAEPEACELCHTEVRLILTGPWAVR